MILAENFAMEKSFGLFNLCKCLVNDFRNEECTGRLRKRLLGPMGQQ